MKHIQGGSGIADIKQLWVSYPHRSFRPSRKLGDIRSLS